MSIETQTKNLLKALAENHPLRLSKARLREDFGLIFPVLSKLNLLRRVGDISEIECPATGSNVLHTVTPLDGKFYASCNCEEGTGLIEVQGDEIEQFEFDLHALLTWLHREMKLREDMQETHPGMAWFLGRTGRGKDGRAHYFVRTDDLKVAVDFVGKLAAPSPAVLWLGDSPHTGHPPKVIVSLLDALKASKNGLRLDGKGIFRASPPTRQVVQGKDILLDRDIALRMDGEKYYLLFDREGDIFQRKESIRPQAFEMIRFVHTMRNKRDRAFRLEELADRLSIAQKRTVSDRIRDVNDLCSEVEAKPIFHKFPEDKWGLNPNLDTNL